MTVKLNGPGYEHAKRLIVQGKVVDDERDAWSDHHPSTQIEEEFIKDNGLFEYGKWFLGINDEYRKDRSRHYEFAHGDFKNVHRCGILAAQDRVRQERRIDVENAVADLLAVIAKQSCRNPASGSAAGFDPDQSRESSTGATCENPEVNDRSRNVL